MITSRSAFIRTALHATVSAFVATVSLPLLTGCDAPAPESASSPAAAGGTGASPAAGGSAPMTAGGNVSIEGSDTLLPLSQKWVEAFGKKNPNAKMTVTGGGSGQGITALINGTAAIANASRAAEDKEKDAAKAKGFEMVETAVARDGITIVVHPSNTVQSLTLEQLKGIYTGKINNWKEIGGPDTKIIASGRDTASGTYKYFQEDVLKKEKYRPDMLTTPSNNKIADNVSKQKGGIGYIGVAYATEFVQAGKVKEVPVAFKQGDAPVLPTSENILSGKYPISRALFNYTKGQPEGVVKEYLDFVTGPEGQEIVKKEGYITLK
ncbi:MAG: PstS family phosphate ABC transporter substrate-binding protein [Capsulimonadales bacterium]|nr:PstS family phosphate ABC transporter substrate-binding protein [Capsulimonadales bacterium]